MVFSVKIRYDGCLVLAKYSQENLP